MKQTALVTTQLLTGADEDSLQRWTELRLGYTETQGLPALRDAISERYTRVGPDEVVVLAPEEGIFLTMQAALRPGQHVIVTYPGYQSLYDVARSIGCTVSFWRPRCGPIRRCTLSHSKRALVHSPFAPHPRLRTEPSGELRFVVDDLEELVHQGPKPALVATNWPHNPTGATLREEDLRRVAALVGDAGALLFCDEMYRTLEHDPGTRPTAGADVGPHVVSLSGLSKTLGMPGLRIGWLAVRDAALRQRILELKDFTTICNSCASEVTGPGGRQPMSATTVAVSLWVSFRKSVDGAVDADELRLGDPPVYLLNPCTQVLALMALRRHDAILAEKLAIVRANLDLLDRFFDKYRDHFAWVRPPASTVAFPKLTSAALGPRGIDDFCSRLVEASGVLLLPASVYGDAEFTDARHFRIGYGRQSMPVALEAFEAHLRSVL